MYVLVELRKLMELNGDLDNYPALKFYCDWVAHSSMDRSAAQRIVERFDRYEQLLHEGAFDAGQEVHERDKELLAELRETLELTNFQRELGQYLTSHVLDAIPFETWGSWITFMTHYAAVVQDCPLKCRGQDLAFVDEVVARVVKEENDDDEDNLSGELDIEWRWVSKHTGKPRTYRLLLSSAWGTLRSGQDF
jgi:hypothetical protein